MRTFLVIVLGVISGVYLLNPGFGLIEVIPDNAPFIGNLDEAGAMALLLMCFRYFGFDVTKLFERKVIEI